MSSDLTMPASSAPSTSYEQAKSCPTRSSMTIHVLCFGNLLQGDDGFGIHVYRRLCAEALPPCVRVFDAGIAGLSALAHFDGCERAVVVYALADF